MSSFRRSSQPGSPTSQADSLLAGLPGKPLVYTLFVYTLIQKTLIEKVEFYWPSYLCNHGSRLCDSLLLSFHFLRSKSQCSGFSAWRLTRTDCDTLRRYGPAQPLLSRRLRNSCLEAISPCVWGGGSPSLSDLLPLASAQAASDSWTLQAGFLPLEA